MAPVKQEWWHACSSAILIAVQRKGNTGGRAMMQVLRILIGRTTFNRFNPFGRSGSSRRWDMHPTCGGTLRLPEVMQRLPEARASCEGKYCYAMIRCKIAIFVFHVFSSFSSLRRRRCWTG